MNTYTPEAQHKLKEYLDTHDLPAGLGTEESACSIAAINLAMTGELTDDIPPCMSEVLGKVIIALQDAMPDNMRNSRRYKEWLPHAAGTGREREEERLAVLMDWLWDTVLPKLQPMADKLGFGLEWAAMCRKRTAAAADAARAAADYAAVAAAVAARAAAYAAPYAARAAARAAARDAAATYAARAAARDAAAAYAAAAAAYAADAAAYAARAAATDSPTFWQDVDTIGVLERMTFLGVKS